MPQPRYSKEEYSNKGRELYRERIEPQLPAGLDGKIVALDIESGEYEVGDKVIEATHKLRARVPDAQIWCERVGFPVVYKFGARLQADES